MNIFQNGVPTHRLILYEAQKPITKGEYCLLSHLADYVEYLLYHQHIPISGQANDLHRILKTTLSDRSADYLDISHQLSSLGWNTRHEYLCLVYQTTYLDQKNMTTRAICNYMENHFPDCSSFLFKDEIVTFFNLSLLHAGSDEIASKLTYFIRDSFLKAGYSRAMTLLRNMENHRLKMHGVSQKYGRKAHLAHSLFMMKNTLYVKISQNGVKLSMHHVWIIPMPSGNRLSKKQKKSTEMNIL